MLDAAATTAAAAAALMVTIPAQDSAGEERGRPASASSLRRRLPSLSLSLSSFQTIAGTLTEVHGCACCGCGIRQFTAAQRQWERESRGEEGMLFSLLSLALHSKNARQMRCSQQARDV